MATRDSCACVLDVVAFALGLAVDRGGRRGDPDGSRRGSSGL